MFSSNIRLKAVVWTSFFIAVFAIANTNMSGAPPAKAGASPSKAGSPEPRTSGGKHFLWRVTNAPAPFYLLGSWHALRSVDYPLGPEIDHAISESKRILFEFDQEHTDYEVWTKKMKDASHYPVGTTFKQKVRPETYAYVQKIAKTRASSYNDVKPWAIAFFMFQHPLFRDVHGYLGVESYVRKKARTGTQYGGLETVDEHIRVLTDMTDIEGEIFLLQAMVYGDARVKKFSDGVAAWKGGNTQGVVQVYASEEREAPFLTWRLITRRNANWIPKIEAEIKSGKPTMIVAGARHFCGTQSVITLLQARGYKIEQL